MDGIITAKKFKPQFIVIEDEPIIAQEIQDALPICRTILTNASIIRNIDQLEDHPSLLNPLCVFWVDINLGTGRRDEGYQVIETIRRVNEGAYIVVYTANGDEERSLNAGANLWRRKPVMVDDASVVIGEINRHIEDFLLTDKTIQAAYEVSFAEVENIDLENKVVTILRYLDDDKIEEADLGLNLFDLIPDLSVNTLLKLSVYSLSGLHMYIEETDVLPTWIRRFRKFDNGAAGTDLSSSDIWNP